MTAHANGPGGCRDTSFPPQCGSSDPRAPPHGQGVPAPATPKYTLAQTHRWGRVVRGAGTGAVPGTRAGRGGVGAAPLSPGGDENIKPSPWITLPGLRQRSCQQVKIPSPLEGRQRLAPLPVVPVGGTGGTARSPLPSPSSPGTRALRCPVAGKGTWLSNGARSCLSVLVPTPVVAFPRPLRDGSKAVLSDASCHPPSPGGYF